MSRIGIQWQRETDAVLEYNRLVLPKVLKSVNGRSREFWQQLVNDNPDSIRIYRHYPNYDDWRDEPEQCAVNAVYTIMTAIAHIQDLITAVEDNNEWVFPFFSDAEIDAADRYMETFIKTAWNSFGMRTVFLNSACGHWGDDITIFWRTLQAAEQCGAVLGQHEYDWPTMMRIYEESGEYWLCGKWKKAMAAIKAESYENIKVIITECGIDGGVADKPMKGWKSVPNSLENYCASLLWYNDMLIADDDMLGAAIFIMSGEGMWSDFDIEGSEVPARIALFPTVPPPEPPELPPEDKMKVRVFDLDGKERDEEYAKTKYGVEWRRAEAAVGEKVYCLIELWEKTGHHSLITQVLDEDGQPMADVPVTFYWSDAPQPPEPPTPVYPHDWFKRFVWGKTNVNGDVGPGMGTGAYHGPGEGGPHAVWIHDPSIPSDICEKLGMMAGTFHDHFDQKFKLMVKGEENGTPPPGLGRFELVGKEVFENQPKNQIIIEVEGERDFYDVRASITVKGSDVDMGPFHPVSIKQFELDTTYTPVEGEQERTFLVTLEHPDGAVLGGPWEFLYHTGVLAEWQATVKWTVEEPDDGDLLTVLLRMDKNLAAIKEKYVGGGEEPPPPPLDTPFHGEYFNNKTLSGAPVLIRDDEKIDFAWGSGSPKPGVVNADDFSVRWTTKKTFEGRTYTFHALTDDGFRLWVDGQLLIDAWKLQAPTPYQAVKTMTAGQHDIKVEFYERGGGATCKLWWQ